MNSRFAWIITHFALAIPLLAFALATASPAAAAGGSSKRSPQPMDSAQAQALDVTETKLAALGKDAVAAPTATQIAAAMQSGAEAGYLAAMQEDGTLAVTPKGADKKRHHRVLKKRHSKANRASREAQAKEGLGKNVQNVVDRRLTHAEVLNILSTTRDFSGSDLSGMNLKGINFSGVKFNRTNLHLANMERADLAESDLELADLTGADLRGASLIQARFRGTLLQDTHMEGALWVDKMVCKKGSVGSCIE